MDEREMIAMFHAMYDNFPTRVRLIRRDRVVLAVNKIAAGEGFQVGCRCIDQGTPSGHKNCKANLALKEKRGVSFRAENGAILFWAPLEGFADVYIHGSFPPPEG